MRYEKKNQKSKSRLPSIIKGGLTVLISVLVVFTVVKASTVKITPPIGTPVATFYSLSEIYNFITSNTIATEGSPALDFSSALEDTGRTLAEIYTALANRISAAKVKIGTTYLGVEGTLYGDTDPTKVLTVSGGTYSAANLIQGNIKLGVVFGASGESGTLAPDGTAAATDCLDTKTFYSDNSWTKKTGSIANCGSEGSQSCYAAGTYYAGTLKTLSADSETVNAGYYAATTLHAVDGDLATGNIRSTVNIFGIPGDSNVVNTSTGDAVLTDILSGKKCWVDGAEVTGNVTAGANVSGADGSITFAIPDGLYSSKTCTAVDGDLAAGNIKKGTDILGVTGTMFSGTSVKTGQTIATYGTSRTCGDGGTGTCEDGYYQSGLALSYSNVEVGANPQYVAVNDLNTGLMWQKCSAGLSDTNKAGTCVTGLAATLAWKTAGNVTEAIDYCENLELCNDGTFQGDKTTEGDCSAHSGALYINWRLPNVKELFSIVKEDAGPIPPYINKTYFPNTVSGRYWSSTTYPNDTTYAFFVHFGYGFAGNYGKTNTFFVRCVRQ